MWLTLINMILTHFPKLAERFKAKLVISVHNRQGEIASDGDFYRHIKVENKGFAKAEKVKVSFRRLFRQRPDKSWELTHDGNPFMMNPQNHGYETVDIEVNDYRIFDLGRLNAKQVSCGFFLMGKDVRPEINRHVIPPRPLRAEIVAEAANCPPKSIVVEIIWNGDYVRDAYQMSKNLTVEVVKVDLAKL